MEPQAPETQNPEPRAPRPAPSAGPLITLLIVVIAIVVGALYVWGQRLAEEENRGVIPQENTSTEEQPL